MSVKAKIHDTHTILPQERMCENSCKGDVTLRNTKHQQTNSSAISF